ncbi:MAG TPA: lamin tail domain-containing protein [Candidatus Moranbacteria bacterium]|nr:lamin tail domain-containing protein [Candidatus Moranbacteria bacterium]
MKNKNWLLIGGATGLFLLFNLFSGKIVLADDCVFQISDDRVEAVLEKMIGEKLERIIERRLAETDQDIQKDDEEIEKLEAELAEMEELSAKELLTDESSYVNKVVINEVMPNPLSDKSEWIELYNNTDQDISLENWFIFGTNFVFIEGQIINAGEYLLIDLESSSQLTNTGEKIILKDSLGAEVSSVEWKNAKKGESWARKPNGVYEWVLDPTPGGENIFLEPEDPTEEQTNTNPQTTFQFNDIIINELLPNPVGSDTGSEWIELYNSTDQEIYFDGWTMRDTSKVRHVFPSDFSVPAKEYRYFLPKFSLNNSGEEKVTLFDPTGKIIDEVNYSDAPEGESWARNKDGEFNWTKILTPEEENRFEEEAEQEQEGGELKKYPSLILSEVLSNPDGVDSGKEWIEIFNPQIEAIQLDDWKIENGSGKKYLLSGEVKAGDYFVVNLKAGDFSLRNTDEELKLIDPNGERVDQISIEGIAPSGKSFAQAKGGDWRWTRYLTPGQENRFNQLPKIKISVPKRLYPGEYGIFDASKTKDADGDKLKFAWIWEEDKKSYQAKTRRKFEEKGNYKIILKVNDGTDEVEKNFRVKVSDFPKEEVRVIGLLPNPVGVDSGREKIVFKNNSDKNIDLLNWQLALGGGEGNLSVRKINKPIIIKAGEVFELYSGDGCRFSLNNSGGIVELRYPDGKEADQVEYSKEKIEEGESYVLVGENWIWKKEKEDQLAGEKEQRRNEEKNELISSSEEATWRWWEVTHNQLEGICEGVERLSYDNWKDRNAAYFRFLKFKIND